jgi:hypothetical protein
MMAFGLSTAGNIKLFDMMMPLDEVTFDLNPKSFTVKKGQSSTARPQTSGGQSGAAPTPGGAACGYTSMYRGTTPTEITFTALLSSSSSGGDVFEASAIGGGIKARCDLLLSWTQPGGGSLLGKAVSGLAALAGFKFQTTARPTLLTLQWGDPAHGFLMRGTLKGVTIDYKRFSDDGNPVRAEVTCTFSEAPNFLLTMLTNPTSGGVQGRRSHLLTEGETLPALALAYYGRPQAWREIAGSNGIDDPLRIRPGRRVYLPPPAEMTG